MLRGLGVVWACRKNGQTRILRRALEPRCEENRPTEWPRIRWFSQVLEDMKTGKTGKKLKKKDCGKKKGTGEFSCHDPYETEEVDIYKS